MRILAFVITAVLSLFPIEGAAQVVAVRSNGDAVSVRSTDKLTPAEKEVLAADADWARAYRSCDMTLMDRVLHDDVMFIHAHARVDTKALLMKQFGACGNEETIIDLLRVVVMSPDTAVVEAGMKLRQRGLTEPVQSLYTRVYLRQQGVWRMIANQTTRNPGVDAAGKPLPNPAFSHRAIGPQRPPAANASPLSFLWSAAVRASLRAIGSSSLHRK